MVLPLLWNIRLRNFSKQFTFQYSLTKPLNQLRWQQVLKNFKIGKIGKRNL